jgi:hypothetical protein
VGEAARAKRERRATFSPVAAQEQRPPADARKVALIATGALGALLGQPDGFTVQPS